jgi:uncharacterized protein YhbP (UPF0306 family)
MDELLKNFLDSQYACTISIQSGNEIWPFIVYYAYEDNKLYFVSKKESKHSSIIANGNINCSLSIVWYDINDLDNRKAIQAHGVVRELKGIKETIKGMKVMDKRYPTWKFNLKEVSTFLINKAIYEIDISYIKYWDDEKLGNTRKEYIFNV